MKDVEDILHKTTLTASVPLSTFVWLKQTQRNCSKYVADAIAEKRAREAQEATQ